MPLLQPARNWLFALNRVQIPVALLSMQAGVKTVGGVLQSIRKRCTINVHIGLHTAGIMRVKILP